MNKDYYPFLKWAAIFLIFKNIHFLVSFSSSDTSSKALLLMRMCTVNYTSLCVFSRAAENLLNQSQRVAATTQPPQRQRTVKETN